MKHLLRDERGASAAEFAMVLPLLLIFLFGIIDGGRLLWEWNRAEKATQMGSRYAAVTNVVAGGLRTKNFVGVNNGSGTLLTQGDIIPVAAMGTVTCDKTSCTCTGTCPTGILGTYNEAAFDAIVSRIAAFKPDVTEDNVIVEYRGSGLGFAGDPTGMDISPIVSVRLTQLQFQPITSLVLASVTLPDFASSLTMEDGIGTQSN